MGRLKKLFDRVSNNPNDVRFNDMRKLAEAFGFIHRGGKGSHEVYNQKGVEEIVNFQNVNGKVKPYQVKQFLKLIQEYNLRIRED
ncbi:MAG TPA: type II toxin-antitoxin system HicA family toxin [Thermodesulfovibrionales bacterium]|nr:type II toxin-antitoxin system HicA family toxin [Thermodesulfovibrionales bacterium]